MVNSDFVLHSAIINYQRMQSIDTQLFFWINSHHCIVADWVLWTASQAWSWPIVLLIVLACTTLRKEPQNWWLVLVGIGLCFLLSDRISVMSFKEVACRLRPCHALEDVRMFRTTCGGLYGFVSSHAANVFALATFFSMRYGRRNSKAMKTLVVLLFLWAIIVGYSRPYLGKHYPGDVLCGAILGIGVGALIHFMLRKFEQWKAKKNCNK